MKLDAHHHLWDLSAVHYPWLMAQGAIRFFGDPAPIQRDYLLPEFRKDAAGFEGSVHIQVGAEDPRAEALWVQSVADANPEWLLRQVVFCDLTDDRLEETLDWICTLPTVAGVRQIVGRAPGEDSVSGTNTLLRNPRFAEGLRRLSAYGFSFDLQLIPSLYDDMARVLDRAPDTRVALCHCGSPTDRTAAGILDWAKALGRLSERDQIWCKLSGLGMFEHDWTRHSIAPLVAHCIDQFGTDRIMFGSNFPVDSLYSDYATLWDAMHALVPPQAHEKVFGSNCAAFYGFEGKTPPVYVCAESS